MSKPIYGHVLPADVPNAVRVDDAPQAPPAKPKHDPSWRKGLPRTTKKSDVFGPAGPGGSPVLRPCCVGCTKALTPLDLPMIAELVRVARDRMSEAGGDGRTDVLFLAARLDGYCSLGCWRLNADQKLVGHHLGRAP